MSGFCRNFSATLSRLTPSIAPWFQAHVVKLQHQSSCAISYAATEFQQSFTKPLLAGPTLLRFSALQPALLRRRALRWPSSRILIRSARATCPMLLRPSSVMAHKGYAWFEIRTHGRAAHGSLPAEGRDAIRMMGRVFGALDELEQIFAVRPAHPLLGQASLHASLISGGQELSSYPAECHLQ